MQITDPVADMLTRIRNANTAKHEKVDVPASNLKKAIAQILLDEGYIKAYEIVDDGTQGIIRITLKYLVFGRTSDRNDIAFMLDDHFRTHGLRQRTLRALDGHDVVFADGHVNTCGNGNGHSADSRHSSIRWCMTWSSA